MDNAGKGCLFLIGAAILAWVVMMAVAPAIVLAVGNLIAAVGTAIVTGASTP